MLESIFKMQVLAVWYMLMISSSWPLHGMHFNCY